MKGGRRHDMANRRVLRHKHDLFQIYGLRLIYTSWALCLLHMVHRKFNPKEYQSEEEQEMGKRHFTLPDLYTRMFGYLLAYVSFASFNFVAERIQMEQPRNPYSNPNSSAKRPLNSLVLQSFVININNSLKWSGTVVLRVRRLSLPGRTVFLPRAPRPLTPTSATQWKLTKKRKSTKIRTRTTPTS